MTGLSADTVLGHYVKRYNSSNNRQIWLIFGYKVEKRFRFYFILNFFLQKFNLHQKMILLRQCICLNGAETLCRPSGFSPGPYSTKRYSPAASEWLQRRGGGPRSPRSNETPNAVVQVVQIWRVWRPLIWANERDPLTLQILNRLACGVCGGPILLE